MHSDLTQGKVLYKCKLKIIVTSEKQSEIVGKDKAKLLKAVKIMTRLYIVT